MEVFLPIFSSSSSINDDDDDNDNDSDVKPSRHRILSSILYVFVFLSYRRTNQRSKHTQQLSTKINGRNWYKNGEFIYFNFEFNI